MYFKSVVQVSLQSIEWIQELRIAEILRTNGRRDERRGRDS